MNEAKGSQLSAATLHPTDGVEFIRTGAPKDDAINTEIIKLPALRSYVTKHMKLFPELYRRDVSIHPSYTGLKNLPYYVVCRRRALKLRKQITRQLNREIANIVMMQNSALAGVRVDRIFSIGFPPKSTLVPDFAADKERRRINELLADR